LVITSATCFLALAGRFGDHFRDLLLSDWRLGNHFRRLLHGDRGFLFAITWGGISFVITSGASLVIT